MPIGQASIGTRSTVSGGGSGGGGLAGLGLWRYRTETTSTPSSGRLQFDDTTIDDATELYINVTNDDGTDMSAFLSLILSGDLIYIQVQDDATQFVIVQVGSSSLAGGVYTFPVVEIEGQGTTPTNNTEVAVVISSIGLAEQINVSIADFTVGDVYYLTQRVNALPVTRINVVIQGSGGQSITWELRKGSDISAAGTVVHTATTTNTTSGDTITVITTPAVVANDHLWFEFTAVAGTLLAFNANVSF